PPLFRQSPPPSRQSHHICRMQEINDARTSQISRAENQAMFTRQRHDNVLPNIKKIMIRANWTCNFCSMSSINSVQKMWQKPLIFYFIVIMSNLVKLEFEALDISRKNYISRTLDAEIHLAARGLGETIISPNNSTIQDKAKAMILLRHHLNEALKNEYLTVKDLADLWKALKERYDHQKTVILPRARYEWMYLRFQDFKTVNEYNSAMVRIFSVLKLCGENITDYDMLEKTLSTFHASNVLLQQQYRAKGFVKYSELISCLLLAEQNNELLMKNHESRPTGSTAVPEIYAVISRQGTRNENSQTY
ncbi:Unknown protein, partial [Striga hermonthica]